MHAMSIIILALHRFYHLIKLIYPFDQKRFNTRGTLGSIRISRLARISPVYRNLLRSLNLKKNTT